MINGHVDGRFLDDQFFWPVFEAAEALGVPIYLHPTVPPQPVIEAYYQGFAPGGVGEAGDRGPRLAHRHRNPLHPDDFGWRVRPVSRPAGDRRPPLRGAELDGVAYRLCVPDRGDRPAADRQGYLRENFYGGILAGEFAGQEPGSTDPGWSLSFNAYQAMVNVIGIDRIVFTADYPFANMAAGRQFLEQMPIPPVDREKIAHRNAERLLGLE